MGRARPWPRPARSTHASSRDLARDIDVISFGVTNDAVVTATDIVGHAAGSDFNLHMPGVDLWVDLPIPGAHNVLNACAAAAVAYGLKVDPGKIKRGLESTLPVAGRLQPIVGLAGSSLYDDSYNANPASVIAAAEFLAGKGGESFLVFGDMYELGSEAESLHKAVGRAAKVAGIDHLYATGELSRHTVEAFGSNAVWYENVEDLTRDLKGAVSNTSNVLVKGSRSMRMERVVDALRELSVAQQEA